MQPAERKKSWATKRVFFLTPQVLMNDLSREALPALDVKCLVVDEAHKALGNHAYCQVSYLSECLHLHKFFNEITRHLQYREPPLRVLNQCCHAINNVQLMAINNLFGGGQYLKSHWLC